MRDTGPGRGVRLGKVSVFAIGLALTSTVLVPKPGSATTVVAGAGSAPAATAGGAFSKTETITRNHLLNGADDVVDKRTVKVSVSDTQGLRDRQEVTVTWSGAHPTGGLVGDENSALAADEEYPVVLMECRGVDSNKVPPSERLSPQTCWTHTPGERTQSDYNNNYPVFRLDRYASAAGRALDVGLPSPVPAPCAGLVNGAQNWVPFVAANGTVYSNGVGGCAGIAPEEVINEQSLLPDNTTYAATDRAGNGSAKFIISSAVTNASLGCSNTVVCSLEVIPIMGISCDPAGAGLPPADQVPPGAQAAEFALCSETGVYQPGQDSFGQKNSEDLTVAGDLWWSPSNWRNRISVPLTFAPLSNVCTVSKSATSPLYMYGSELMAEATQQWAPAFCLNPKLFAFDHVQTSEPEAKNLLQTGSIEAAIQGEPPQTPFTAPTVQAPIGLTGFAVSYDIDSSDGSAYHQLKLTPRLLAKLLTESYPGVPAIGGSDPALSQNPLNITSDPEFRALNPIAPGAGFQPAPASTLFTVSSDSDVIWALTSYINSDPEAKAWLNGAPDPWGMVINPAYKGIKLPLTSWPLLDTFESGPAYNPSNNPCLASSPVPFLPLVAAPQLAMQTVALNMQYGIAPSQIVCSNAGLPTQKLVAVGRENPGQRFLIGVTSLADADQFQLDTAALQTQVSSSAPAKFSSASGRAFVAPTGASLRAAAEILQPDPQIGTWLLPTGEFHNDPRAADAYPGTMLMSVDIPTSGLPTSDAKHYATFLDFAATSGQTPGGGNGQLPAGYLPMTAANGMASMAAYTEGAACSVAAQTGSAPSLAHPSSSCSSGVKAPPPPPSTSQTGGNAGSGGSSASNTGGGLGGSNSGAGSGGNSSGTGRSGAKATHPSGLPTATRYVQPAAATGITGLLGAGWIGLLLPLLLLVAIVGGLGTALTWWWRRERINP